jgi:hypothetical protein
VRHILTQYILNLFNDELDALLKKKKKFILIQEVRAWSKFEKSLNNRFMSKSLFIWCFKHMTNIYVRIASNSYQRNLKTGSTLYSSEFHQNVFFIFQILTMLLLLLMKYKSPIDSFTTQWGNVVSILMLRNLFLLVQD